MKARDAARLHGQEAIDKLVELLRGDDGRLSYAAAKELLDRGYGRPAQAVTVAGDPDSPVTAVERIIVQWKPTYFDGDGIERSGALPRLPAGED